MRGLNEIVKDNQEAVRQGNTQPGDAVGTSDVKPVLYDVYRNGNKIRNGVTIAQCADLRANQGELEYQPHLPLDKR